VQARAHPAHSIRVDLFLRIAVRDYAGKVEQNPVRMYSRLNRWLNRRTERHFHAQIAALPRHGYVLYGRGSRCALRRGARHEEQYGSEMFLNSLHFLLTLASAPHKFRVLLPEPVLATRQPFAVICLTALRLEGSQASVHQPPFPL